MNPGQRVEFRTNKCRVKRTGIIQRVRQVTKGKFIDLKVEGTGEELSVRPVHCTLLI